MSIHKISISLNAGFHMSHFIAFYRISLQFIGCPLLRLYNYVEIENRNSSEFVLIHRRKQNFFHLLGSVVTNCDELGLIRILIEIATPICVSRLLRTTCSKNFFSLRGAKPWNDLDAKSKFIKDSNNLNLPIEYF